MTKRWLALGALALAVATGALSASAASATDPLTLDSGYVTDQADVLSPVEEEQVEEFTFADRSAGVRSAPAVATVAEIIHPDLFE